MKPLRLLLRGAFTLIFGPPLLMVLLAAFSARALKAFFDELYLRALLNSLLIASGTTFFSILLAFPLAILLSRTPFPKRRILALLLIVPLLFLPYQTALSWSFILPEGMGKYFFSLPGVIFIHTLSFFPLVFGPLYLSFLSVPPEAEESALLCRVPQEVFFRITLRYALPYLWAGAGLCFFFSFSEIGVPTYLGVPVVVGEILTRFAAFYDFKGALAASFPLALLGLCFFGLERPFLARFEFPARFEDQKRLLTFKNPFLLVSGGLLLFSLLLGAVFFPLFLLAIKAGKSLFSVFGQAFFPALRSIFYAAGSAILASLLVFLALPSLTDREKRFWESLSLLCFFLPPVVTAVGLIYFWGRFPWVYGSVLLLFLGLTARFAFLPKRLLGEAWRRFNKEALLAAYLSPRGLFSIFWRILFPPLKPWFALAVAFFFIFAGNELVLATLLYPPGGAPLAVTIYTLSVNNPLSVSAGLCLWHTLTVFTVVAFIFLIFRPRKGAL